MRVIRARLMWTKRRQRILASRSPALHWYVTEKGWDYLRKETRK